MIKLPDTLEQPSLPSHLPIKSRWLAGEGAGSWFVVISTARPYQYNISRYSPAGTLECSGEFQSKEIIDTEDDFEITYPSHCQTVTILQSGHTITCHNLTGLLNT